MALDSVERHAKDYGMQCIILPQITLKVMCLQRASAGPILWVEVKYNPPPFVIG